MFGFNLLLIYNNSAKIKTSVSYYLLAGMMGDGLNLLYNYRIIQQHLIRQLFLQYFLLLYLLCFASELFLLNNRLLHELYEMWTMTSNFNTFTYYSNTILTITEFTISKPSYIHPELIYCKYVYAVVILHLRLLIIITCNLYLEWWH